MRKIQSISKLEVGASRIESELKNLKNELKEGRVINDFSSITFPVYRKIDIQEVKRTQELILDYLDVEVVSAHEELKKKTKKEK